MMQSDRELLEAAARAAGMRIDWRPWPGVLTPGRGWEEWNPLTDDGDALRLAVKLQMEIKAYDTSGHAASALGGLSVCSSEKGDPYIATRRAIVRAAAALAPTTPPKEQQ